MGTSTVLIAAGLLAGKFQRGTVSENCCVRAGTSLHGGVNDGNADGYDEKGLSYSCFSPEFETSEPLNEAYHPTGSKRSLMQERQETSLGQAQTITALSRLTHAHPRHSPNCKRQRNNSFVHVTEHNTMITLAREITYTAQRALSTVHVSTVLTVIAHTHTHKTHPVSSLVMATQKVRWTSVSIVKLLVCALEPGRWYRRPNIARNRMGEMGAKKYHLLLLCGHRSIATRSPFTPKKLGSQG